MSNGQLPNGGHSKHEPFEVVEARRQQFPADKFQYSQQPNPDWKPGQGLSALCNFNSSIFLKS